VQKAGAPIGKQSRIIQDHRHRMRVREIQRAARLQEIGNDLCPSTNIRQPCDRAPSYKYHIECRSLGNCPRRIVKVRRDEVRTIG
jgi:hypothetical protein